MATCSLYSSLQVSGANQTSVNGTYTSVGLDSNGYTKYALNGETTSTTPYIGKSGSSWVIFGEFSGSIAPRYASSSSDEDCPPLGNWVTAGPGGGGGGAATVAGTSAAPSTASPTVKIENANVKFQGKVKIV